MMVGDKSGLMSEINVTPFVDVMLVLLIIFMVTAPMMIQGVDVDLPEAGSPPLDAKEEQLVVTINQENQIFIQDFQVSLDYLREKLAKILENRTGKDVFLRADKRISYGMVVNVMTELKAAGVDKLGMITEPPEDRKTP